MAEKKDNYLFRDWNVFKEPCDTCAYRLTPTNGPFCCDCIHILSTSKTEE